MLVKAAVGEKSGKATLYSPQRGSAYAALVPGRDGYVQKMQFSGEEVDVITIDEFLEAESIERVDFMKVDTEGNDLAVLRGARKSLEAKRVKALSFEFGSANVNSRSFFHDFWDLLHSVEYSIKRICPGGILAPLDEYYEDLEYFRGVSNCLAAVE